MPNTKEIKDRINSVRDTQKITNAMYLISSTKLQKAKSGLEKTKPYFNALRGEITRIFRTVGKIENRYVFPDPDTERTDGVSGILVVTADKGLAGAYNQNVLKEAARVMEEYKDCRLYVVGEYGRQYYKRKKIPVEQSFLYTAQNPTFGRAREIAAILMEGYDQSELDRIFVIYTDMKNSMSQEAVCTQILPFYHSHFIHPGMEEVTDQSETFEFYPSAETVLENAIFSYVSGFIYSALVDSFCSEQNARMNAMRSANDNAEKILDELSIQYNRVRQAQITQEITEVSAGAKAQKKKRKKEESGA